MKKQKQEEQDFVNKGTGQVIGKEALNKVITTTTVRPNGTRRIRHDYSNCPTMAEQHTAHLTDINYLMERYKPDELAAYISARNQYRREILSHDFSQEPSLQDAKNVIYRSKQEFESLDPDIRSHFKNHLEFLKFIDNPANAEKMLKLGILTKKQIETIQITETPTTTTSTPQTTTQEEDKKAK